MTYLHGRLDSNLLSTRYAVIQKNTFPGCGAPPRTSCLLSPGVCCVPREVASFDIYNSLICLLHLSSVAMVVVFSVSHSVTTQSVSLP